MSYNGLINDSEKSMKTATTQADRMALIAEVHQRSIKLKKLKGRVKTRPQVNREFVKPLVNKTDLDDNNINHYTDASKYAKEYYGDILYETRRFDNPGIGEDWGDY